MIILQLYGFIVSVTLLVAACVLAPGILLLAVLWPLALLGALLELTSAWRDGARFVALIKRIEKKP